jgi:hypothetical protein
LRNRGEGAAGWRKRKDMTSRPGWSVAVREGRGKMGWRGVGGPKERVGRRGKRKKGGRKGGGSGPAVEFGPEEEMGHGLAKKGKGRARSVGAFCFLKLFSNLFKPFSNF